MTALEKLEDASRRNRSLLCVGLDPEPDRLPATVLGEADPVLAFNRAIIEATSDLACAYKPNLAFYEALGLDGWRTLAATIAAVPAHLPVILDGKRGDIGNTARRYAEGLYRHLGGDAATVNAYMGRDAVQPFLEVPGKLTFLLAATSNPGAAEIQDAEDPEGLPLWRRMARLGAALHGQPGDVGLVAGATRPETLAAVRREAPELWLLVPGVGAQGGDLARAVDAALDARGSRALINASRSVLYASRGDDFAKAARQAAEELRNAIERCRPARV